MPQMGHVPGLSEITCGCIGQMYLAVPGVVVLGSVVIDGPADVDSEGDALMDVHPESSLRQQACSRNCPEFFLNLSRQWTLQK